MSHKLPTIQAMLVQTKNGKIDKYLVKCVSQLLKCFRFSRSNSRSHGSTLHSRSFSFSYLLTGIRRHAKWKTGEETLKKQKAYKKEGVSAETEIDRFEKDFVLPIYENRKSVYFATRGFPDICDRIVRKKQPENMFHSSSESILTETDSGAFSGVSISDTGSEISDSLDRLQCEVTRDSYSDEDIEEGLEKETGWQTICSSSLARSRSQPSDENCEPSALTLKGRQTAECQERVTMTGHNNADCLERVTVNGVCWHCHC